MKNFLPLLVGLPLFAAFLLSLVGRFSKKFSDIVANLATFSLGIISIGFLYFLNVKNVGVLVYKVGGWLPPWGINMVLDGLSLFMIFTVNIIAFFITCFSVNYMEKYTQKEKFYTLFLLMLAGMNGVIISGDIFNLFVFLEIASVASYALVAYGVEAEELEASFKYIVMSSVASLFILLGIAILYSYASTLNMADLAGIIMEKGINRLIIFVGVLFIMGFGLKAAIVPFHAWLPDAHPSAPASISAALSGVLIKALGIYSLVRIFYNVLGVNSFFLNTLTFLGVLSIMVGVLLAIAQWDLKRLLAYHSISQVGYIILGFGLNTPLGILGGLFHLFNHSIFKSLLFLNSGSIEYSLGTRNLKELGGLREKMPWTAATSFIASMSISGVPPFNGFFSKLLIVLACIEAKRIGLGIWAIIGSILTLSSFMKVQRYAFYGKFKKMSSNFKEAPLLMRWVMIILALICILSSALAVSHVSRYFLDPAKDVLMKGLRYKEIVLRNL